MGIWYWYAPPRKSACGSREDLNKTNAYQENVGNFIWGIKKAPAAAGKSSPKLIQSHKYEELHFGHKKGSCGTREDLTKTHKTHIMTIPIPILGGAGSTKKALVRRNGLTKKEGEGSPEGLVPINTKKWENMSLCLTLYFLLWQVVLTASKDSATRIKIRSSNSRLHYPPKARFHQPN